MIHDLKCWPVAFARMLDGTKRFDIRKDDRPFAVGDVLRQREFDPEAGGYSIVEPGDSPLRPVGAYTGRELSVTVVWVERSGVFGLPPGCVVMGVELRDACAAAAEPKRIIEVSEAIRCPFAHRLRGVGWACAVDAEECPGLEGCLLRDGPVLVRLAGGNDAR